MRLITGDECGLLKECIPELAKMDQAKDSNHTAALAKPGIVPVSTSAGMQRILDADAQPVASRRRGIVGLTWIASPPTKSPTENDVSNQTFACLRVDGSVEVWKRNDGAKSVDDRKSQIQFGSYRRIRQCTQNIFTSSTGESEVSAEQHTSSSQIRLACSPLSPLNRPLTLASLGLKRPGWLCAGNSQGQVTLLDTHLHDDDGGNGSNVSVVKTFSTLNKSKSSQPSRNERPSSGQKEYSLVTAMQLDLHHDRVALGGKELDAHLYDLETQALIWKAKNLPPHPQTLLPPQVWPSALYFLQGSTSTVANRDNHDNDSNNAGINPSNLLAVGSAHAQVRIYDVRDSAVQRRPILYTPEGWLEHRVTSICQSLHCPNQLIVADSAGYVHSLDLRHLVLGGSRRGRLDLKNNSTINKPEMGRFVQGPAGSVRDMMHHPTLPRLAVVGLDRMLRIYDTKTRKQTNCLYLKQRVNCVLVSPDVTKRSLWEDDDEGDIEEDYGDIDQADVVGDYVADYSDSDNEDGDENDAVEEDQEVAPNSEEESGTSDSDEEDDNHSADFDDEDENDSDDAQRRTKRRRH